MSVRESFVARFGEAVAVKVEEAALNHLAEGPLPHLNPHAEDKWGEDPFQYLFMVCIGRDCLTRWRKYHGIDAEYEDLLDWCVKEGNLHDYQGDMPDFIALLAGAYNIWIDWAGRGEAEPENCEHWRKRNLDWAHMSEVEFAAEMTVSTEHMKVTIESMSAKGMRLLDNHDGEGPL